MAKSKYVEVNLYNPNVGNSIVCSKTVLDVSKIVAVTPAFSKITGEFYYAVLFESGEQITVTTEPLFNKPISLTQSQERTRLIQDILAKEAEIEKIQKENNSFWFRFFQHKRYKINLEYIERLESQIARSKAELESSSLMK